MGNAGGVEGPGSPGIEPSDLMMIENLLSRGLYHTLVEVLLMSQVLGAFGNQVDDDVNVILYNISGDA